MPPPSPRRAAMLVAAVVLLAVGVLRLAPGPGTAGAIVGHVRGHHGTVDGFTSWYGSYDLGSIGPAWCIDHGIRAPDPDLAYVPDDLAGVPAEAEAALAWLVGRWGPSADAVTASAVMLAAHDMMGATYPSGDLDVFTLRPDRLAGFGGAEAAVVEEARRLVLDAVAHRHLRAPWVLELTADVPPAGGRGTLVARLTAGGVPAAGIVLRATTSGAAVLGPGAEGPAVTLLTDADGVVTTPFTAAAGPYQLLVDATLPDLQLQAFAPTRARAQRVIRPATVAVVAALDGVGAVTTTTSTTAPTTTTTTTTSTTAPPTTTSTTSTTSTTPAPTTTTTSTTAAPPTTPAPAVIAPTTTSSAAPPAEVPAPAPRPLPRTGADPLALGCVGSGLVLVGSALRPRRGPATV